MKVVFDEIFLMKLTTFILILMNPYLTYLPISSFGRTRTVCKFLDSASSMRAFSCAECEVVHLVLPEEVREPSSDFMALARWSHLPLLSTSQFFVPTFMVNPTTPWQAR